MRRIGIYLSISIFVFAVLLFDEGCKKGSACHYFSMPNSLFILLTQGGKRLPDSILDYTKISYYQDGNKKYLTDFTHAGLEWNALGIMTTRDIGSASAGLGIKTYFIEYPDATKDTLYADYESPSPSTSCVYVLHTIKYNGMLIKQDTTYKGGEVYVFNKTH